MDTFQPDNGYRIKISVFEGPIDLLLYLIKKKEVDIHEISLLDITKEYLEYVELIKLINLEISGDFIVVASMLMKIKARSLFNVPDIDEGELVEGDTRSALIRYLMEYEKLGSVAEKLAEKETARQGIFPRGGEKLSVIKNREENDIAPDYILFDLLTALRDVLKNAPKSATHEVELFNITSEMKQQEIMAALNRHGKVDFVELVRGQPKLVIVITFIALLELIRMKKIHVRQSQQFGRIMLHKRKNSKD